MAGLCEASDGAQQGLVLHALGGRLGEQDAAFAVRQHHGARQEAQCLSEDARGRAHDDRLVATDVGETTDRRDLAPGRGAERGRCAEDGLDVGMAEQRRARTVGPDHVLEVGRKDRQRVACGEARTHLVEGCDVEEGIGCLRHAAPWRPSARARLLLTLC
ncbi:hypothetical protein [Mesorhizobium marinum]|uniref:hypothetical protein n=1 Tax=Mesorhizobium marinum TaxID=3228790 RepID=UPI003465B051